MTELTPKDVANLLVMHEASRSGVILVLKSLESASMEIPASIALHETDLAACAEASLAAERASRAAEEAYRKAYFKLIIRLVPEVVRVNENRYLEVRASVQRTLEHADMSSPVDRWNISPEDAENYTR